MLRRRSSATPHEGIVKGNAGIARKRQPSDYIAALKMPMTCSNVAFLGLVN
jgi:hypothetical protein